MKYCLKCGWIIADNSMFKDKISCGYCKTELEEDDMTSEHFNKLSEQEKEEYTKSLFNKIKKSNVFDDGLCKYGTPDFYRDYWFERYESITGDVAGRCGDDLKQHMQATYGKGSKLYEEQVVQNCIEADRVRKQKSSNIPKCPTCESTSLHKISTTSKVVNTVAFGLLGTKRHKTFHCDSCGYEW